MTAKFKTNKTKQVNRKLYVAVIGKVDQVRSGRNWGGDWSCFIANSQQEVLEQAETARVAWVQSGRYGPYDILVETLTSVAQKVRPEFTLSPLCGSS